MKSHQILTGACNAGDRTFAIGSVEGVVFSAYAAGCNVVILASDFQRVQIIPGVCHDNIQISCLDCSVDTGKIAVAYENEIIVFEPTPLLEQTSKHGLDYWWVETARLQSLCHISTLAWNNDGNRLLTAGEYIQLWHHKSPDSPETDIPTVTFEIGTEQDGQEQGSWTCVWKTRPANPVVYLAFSPDGTLFATAGKLDRLVRIWYQNQMLLFPGQSQDTIRSAVCYDVSFSYIYLAHPRSVTGISWRKTSKYMPKGSVANMLVTSCLDNICRLWCETILPEDGIVCMQQLDPNAAQNSKFRTHRQKARFIQRFKHMRQSFSARRMTKQSKPSQPDPISTLPSTYSVHEFHNYGFQSTGISPGLHFHLSGTINAVSDIPLVPAMTSGSMQGHKHNFVLHWMNNKEMQFTMEAEKIMEDLFKLALERDDQSIEFELTNPTVDEFKSFRKQQQFNSPMKRIDPDGRSGSSTSLAHSDVSQTGSVQTAGTTGTNQISLSDTLDHRIEKILKEWHQNSDLLFSIHPVDGSLLVWVADFLDEYTPGAFRQAQVSFSSRIPNALPLGDAMTMGANVALYNSNNALNFREIFRMDEDKDEPEDEEKEGESKEMKHDHKYKPAPIISMISKHNNGTLNLWNVMFAEKSKFSQLLNISHASRASGHRFRVNDITCHPVLPLLLTTSHHNIVPSDGKKDEEPFCSELILWRVDPVGPLSRSGGISELARINSQEISAFSDVAWIPTLLPSTTLGSISNSPSACFVASDGHSLRVFQAVIDARTLLAEINSSQRKADPMKSSMMSMSSDNDSNQLNGGNVELCEKFKIVSSQSSARPGAVIELEAIADATQNWQNTLMLHTFQEQMILSQGCVPTMAEPSLIPSKMSAIVDLQHSGGKFHETFFVIVAEKSANGGAIMHMWRLVLSSDAEMEEGEDGASSGSATPTAHVPPPVTGHVATEVHVSTEKVCTQPLPLPSGVSVIHAVPAVGHLSSSSIYPACLAPYVMVTACSDNKIRFWRTKITSDLFEWEEWQMESDDGESEITVPGRPVSVSAAYSGRIAVAYQTGSAFQRPSKDPKTRYVNLCVSIYECESTGGSEWILEDTIYLKNIELHSEIPAMDMSVYDESHGAKRADHFAKMASQLQDMEKEGKANLKGLITVPSLSTFEGIRKYIEKMGNSPSAVAPKQTVMLDWVSKEDGSHILTVAVGNKVLLLTAVSSDISQANMKALAEAKAKSATSRPLLRRSSSIGLQPSADEIRWMQIRRIGLRTADGMNPTPMSCAWVRDGILMCGMDNEIAVYSQWREDVLQDEDMQDIVEHRNLQDSDLMNIAQESQMLNIKTVNSFANVSSLATMKQLADIEKRKKVVVSQASTEEEMMPDFGLFEASHIANPVLPQYHPKQLMELLHSGKIRWVKAILGHLVRCIGGSTVDRRKTMSGGSFTGGEDGGPRSPRSWSRSRTLSVSFPAGTSGGVLSPGGEKRSSVSAIPEEVTLDYTEISSIPPLPLWTLLAADKEASNTGRKFQSKETDAGYDDLFQTSGQMTESDNLENLLEEDDEFDVPTTGEKRMSMAAEKQGLSYFGPRQARILSKLLTHAHLPGLTSLDQMHLLALADTVASCNLDLAERFAIDAAKSAIAKETTGGLGATGEPSLESLDDCGLRFLLAMKHHLYLKRCLPISQRVLVQKQGIATSHLVWGFHSESEEELLNMVPSVAKGSPMWPELRELGIAWWVRNNTTLRKLMEKVAKAAFQAKQDPLDAAIFYLAMKKKSLVWGLFRSIKDDRMTQFFANNFSEDRWRKAALKNAFALLGKQRFLHAAAFFLLSGSLKDAIDICIDKLDDLQLAMVIARLYEGEMNTVPESLSRLLNQHVLGTDEGGVLDLSMATPDPFLRSIAFWITKQYSTSLQTLVAKNVGENHPKYVNDETVLMKKQEADPSVFNFYVYLRTHPLIMRQQMVSRDTGDSAIMLSGFKSNSMDKGNTFAEDSVTPRERRLYFSTAHFHLRGGCPALALDVLSKLPEKVAEAKQDSESSQSRTKSKKLKHIETGTIDLTEMDWSQPVPSKPPKPAKQPEKTDGFDWSQPVTSSDTGLDWSQPLAAGKDDTDELKLEWSDDPDSESDEEDKKVVEAVAEGEEEDKGEKKIGVLDIMAQQLKFIACLKIMMEELSTLATGFEVDGGLLRYQLYIWLEREVEALAELCSYGASTVSRADATKGPAGQELFAGNRSTLHEYLLAEKADFEAKVERATRRKKWLKANQTLLRTMLSYCSLHGANGGGLASVRMELILLLQELQQEKTQKQLLSPLPFPTTLPLLSACIAQQKTVVADPIRHLQAMTHDMLYTIVNGLNRPPPFPGLADYGKLFVLRDMSVALSACVYQSLCDSDSVNIRKPGTREGPASAVLEALSRLSVVYQDSSLIASTSARRLSDGGLSKDITTDPSKWPGVTSLRALLDREKDDETPNLNVLLCETYVSIYMSLLCYALASCDAHILYRLVGQKINQGYWGHIFGGGAKKVLKVETVGQPPIVREKSSDSVATSGGDEGLLNTVTSITKHRVKLNMKLLGVQLGSTDSPQTQIPEKQSYREQFMAPDVSIVGKLLAKPLLDAKDLDIEIDSGGESDVDEDYEEEDDDPLSNAPPKAENVEHSNPQSYSWWIMRYTSIKLAQENLERFLVMAGIELPELPVASPLIYGCLRITEAWIDFILSNLTAFGKPPDNYIPGCFVQPNSNGPVIEKYKALFEPQNTPFPPIGHGLGPIRRLWQYLVRQESVQDIFIKYIFSRRGRQRHLIVQPGGIPESQSFVSRVSDVGFNEDDQLTMLQQQVARMNQPVKVIHKEHEAIAAFCINKVSTGLMAIATQKELQELNISLLLNPNSWTEGMNEEADFDVLNLNDDPESLPASNYLAIQTPGDPIPGSHVIAGSGSNMTSTLNSPNGPQPPPFGPAGQANNPSSKGGTVVRRHRMDGTRRLTAHSHLPLYVSGSQDGTIRMWEWSHSQPVQNVRPPGVFGKVNRVRFSQQGNKFGACDGDGTVSLWQAANAAQPHFTYKCHNKQTSDFVFRGGCSSILATAGLSSDGRNVAVWDTLMPAKRCNVISYTFHENGASAILHAPQHSQLITAGKKGQVAIWDIRQQKQLHFFKAHDHPIKCMALDPNEDFFVTGSADGDIKIWSLTSYKCHYTFVEEHARHGIFKNISQGVSQVFVDEQNRLFSCGADGSMKVRQLPDRDYIVNSI